MTTSGGKVGSSERELFEQWAFTSGYPVHKYPSNPAYEFVETRRMWEAWQARAAIARAEGEGQ